MPKFDIITDNFQFPNILGLDGQRSRSWVPIGKSKSDTKVLNEPFNIINDYFVNTLIDVSGAVCYTFYMFSFSPVTEADVGAESSHENYQ